MAHPLLLSFVNQSNVRDDKRLVRHVARETLVRSFAVGKKVLLVVDDSIDLEEPVKYRM